METKQSNNSATPMADAVKIANQRALFSLEWENDTVFKKRELNYKTKTAFQKDLETGKISKYTTVFIKDSKEIYKNGQYYGSSDGSGASGNLAEYMLVNSEISTEIFSNLKPPFGKQTTFTPSEGLKNLLINNASKNISLITFNYGGENISFGANIAGDSQTSVILTINIHTFPILLGFGTPFSLIYIQLDVESNSVIIVAFPVPCLASESTGNSFFCDDGTFKKESYILNLPGEVLIGTETYIGNLSKEEYDGLVDSYKNNIPITVRLAGLYDVRNCIMNDSPDRYELGILVTSQYGGVLVIVATIFINKSDYSYSSVISKSGVSSPNEDGEIQLYASCTQTSESSISLRADGDGTKFLSNNGRYLKAESEKIDITDIYNVIDSTQNGSKIEKTYYDRLKEYATNKKCLFIGAISNGGIVTDIVNELSDLNVILRYTTYAFGISTPQIHLISISPDLTVTKIDKYYAEIITLNRYKKGENYLPIGVGDSIINAIGKLEAGISFKTLGYEFCSLTSSSNISNINNAIKQSFSNLEELFNYIYKNGKIRISYSESNAKCDSETLSSCYSLNNGDGSYTRMISILSSCMGFAQSEFGGIIKIQYTAKGSSISNASISTKEFL